MELLENPELVSAEINRRVQEIRASDSNQKRKETLIKEQKRIQNAADRLLDAYQEALIPIEELRQRMPQLRKKENALKAELQHLQAKAIQNAQYAELTENMQDFLKQLRISANTLNVKERQKILRLIVKEILVGSNTITIKHSIPVSSKNTKGQDNNELQNTKLLLRTGHRLTPSA